MLVALFIYLAVQLAVGAYVSRRIRSEGDYLLAGRSLGYGLLTFSIFATWFGAETVIGSAGIVYEEGISAASAEPFGYGLCLVLMGVVFAVPLYRRGLTTLADLFRQRFSKRVEHLAALILIPSSILWAAAQIRAFGHVVSIASGTLDVNIGITIAAAFVILYTAFGGLLADAITDVIQSVVLILGIIVVAIAAIGNAGGTAAIVNALGDSARVHLLPPDTSWLHVMEAWAIPVCGSVIATELVGRVIAARSPDVARRSSILGGCLYIAIGLVPVVLGLVGAQVVTDLADPEQLLPVLAQQHLPAVLQAVFLGGLVSAILSTVDSTLLVSSGLLSHNLLVPALRVTNERTKVRLARGGVLLFGIMAYVLAIHATGVFALVEQASALGSAGALVAVCFGLFTNFGGARAAAATLGAGVVSYLAAVVFGAEIPFLISLGSAIGAYVLVGWTERRADLPEATPSAVLRAG